MVAKLATVAIGVGGDVSILDLATISVVGGALASGVVLAVTLILVAAAVRFGWDLDNLVAPVVSTLGDVITIPALWLATFVLGHGSASTAVSVVAIVLAAVLGGRTIWTQRPRLRRIVRESLPILATAAALSTAAGVVLEQQFATFTTYPALLILVPAFVSSAGALGGLLSTRLATALHLGTIQPDRTPSPAVRRDIRVIAALAVIVYLFNGVGALFVAGLLGQPSPGCARP